MLLVTLIAWLVSAAPAPAQDTLARAKDLYSAAAYEEALDVLNRLRPTAAPEEAVEVSVYQAFCLVALGRTPEARTALEAVVRADPLYHLSEASAPPHVRTLFDQVRRPLLPEIVKDWYAKGRDAFGKKDLPAAKAAFDRVIALLDDPDLAKMEGGADLKTLASGFRDLSLPPPPPPAPKPVDPPETPAPKPEPAQPPVRTGPPVYGPDDAGVTAPIAVQQTMPPWNPVTPKDAAQEWRGALELVIDETGRVSSAVLLTSVHRLYDPSLLDAARKWKFLPATVAGSPVRYRYVMGIVLQKIR